jgi:hypothetical protein
MVRELMKGILGILIVGLGMVPAVGSEDNAAVEVLRSVVEIEDVMLDEARSRFESLDRRRADIDGEIELLRETLTEAIDQETEADFRRLSQVVSQLDEMESERDALLRAQRLVVDRIAQHFQRLELFQVQLDVLQAREDPSTGALTGTWDLVLMPGEQRGTVQLQQTGALVSGTYELQGGWSGSLQGTLVNRKVFLVRIDSKLGKSMELEGFLSSDGNLIRGSWLNYALEGNAGSTGQWSARRRGAPR